MENADYNRVQKSNYAGYTLRRKNYVPACDNDLSRARPRKFSVLPDFLFGTGTGLRGFSLDLGPLRNNGDILHLSLRQSLCQRGSRRLEHLETSPVACRFDVLLRLCG